MSKWETTEGGALPGSDGPVEVTITNGSFNYDANYQNGETLVAIIEGDCDHDLWQDSILYSIGTGWETSDNVVVSGRDQFNGSTNYARFFQAALATKAESIIMERAEASGEGPADASIWEGLVFNFERIAYVVNFGKGEETRHLLLPTEFIGMAKKSKGKAKKSKGASKAEVKALRVKIVKLAKKSDDHDEFVEAVLDKFPEVEDMEGLYEEVLDEDGIYDEA